MKKFLLIFSFLLLSISFVFADEIPISAPNLTTPQHILYNNCYKKYTLNKEKLYYLTLASISANRFTIDEIQTANGYVIFTVNRNKYLATVSRVDNYNTILRITPCNSVYNFPPGIVLNIFKYIDLNSNTEIQT